MKKKKQLNRRTSKKYQTGGSSYALPTSLSGTTTNLMGLGDPNTLNKNLQVANSAIQNNADRIRNQEEAKRVQAESLSKDQFQNSLTSAPQNIGADLLSSVQTGFNTARALKGTATGAQFAQIGNTAGTSAMLNSLGNYGSAAAPGGLVKAGAKAAFGQMGPALGGAALGLAGAGVKRLANDSDQTTMNFGETAGTLMQGAGTGLGLAGALGATGFGLPLALLGAAGYGVHGLVQRNKARVAEQAQEEQDRKAQMQLSRAQSQAFIENSTMTGADLGFNTGNSLSNSYIPSQQMMYKSGGEMIKRKDGSYSKRGLWDNIRANKGSGKAPTKEMLEQEKKIKNNYQYGSFVNEMGLGGDPQTRALRKQNRQTRRAQKEFERKSKKGVQNIYEAGGFKVPGGKIMPLQGNAVEFVGKKHSQGGIMLDFQTEVEGGETMDKIEMKNGGKSDYIFSEHLKLGKKSFAKRHKELLKRNASQAEIQQLAKLQEKVAAKQGRTENGERDPDKIMQTGGFSSALFDSLIDIKTDAEESPMKGFLQMQETYAPSGPSTEDNNIYAPGRKYNFDWQARNKNKIDYEFDITGPDATKILNTPWAESWGLPKDMSAEDLQNWYKNTYTPRIREYYKANPEIVEKDIQEMLGDTSDPNQENFKRKISGPDGKPLTGDALIDRAVELATDNKVGSWHSIVPSNYEGSVYTPPEKETPPGEKEKPQEGEKPKEEETPEKKKEPRDLSWMGALPGLLQFQGTPTYPKARTVSPQMQRNVNLPRINMNAERAANSAMNVGTRRQFANQASGPAGMAASLAANQQARQQNLEIGNLEGRTNKDLMAQEASINANIASQNASSANQAGQFNAQMLQQRDQNQFDQSIYNKMHNRDVMSGTIRDAMTYKAEERYAKALDDVGAYMRFVQDEQNKNKTKEDTTTKEKTTDVVEETKKFGGKYIRKVNAVKRKKKK